jgi:uncharacterized protein (DUF2164 family)
MPIELKPHERTALCEQIKFFCDDTLECPVGDLKAALVLDFCLNTIGPAIYNQALADARAWLETRLEDLESSLFQAPPVKRPVPRQ